MTSSTTPRAASPHPTKRADGALQRFAGLDGLRAIAVAAVIVYHLFPGVLPGGFLGVDVFFVISGFLITSLLVDERARTGRISLASFWRRRVRRIVPALVAVVLVCSSLAWMVGGDVLVGLGRQVLGAGTFSYNWLDILAGNSYFSKDAPELFRNLWSLAVEEQFYLLWPLLLLALLLVRGVATRIAVLCALALSSGAWMAVLYAPGGDPTRVYFGTDTHSFGLMIGAALALVVSRIRPLDLDAGESRVQAFVRRWLPPLGLVSLALVLVASWWLGDDEAFTYRGGLLLVSLLTALVIWAAVSPGSRLGRALDVAPLRAIGVRSYGLYLWHWPVLVLVAAALPRDADRPAWVAGAIALALTAVAAWVSYRFVEQPIRRHGLRGIVFRIGHRMRLSALQRQLMLGGLLVVALSITGTVTAVASAPDRTSAEDVIRRGAQSIEGARPVPTATPSAPGKPTPTPSATEGAQRPLPTGAEITAVGDSVMLASAPELQAAFPGIAVDAVVSRQMHAAPGILQQLADSGALRRVVVLALGTNGPFEPQVLREVRRVLGPERELVLVNVQAPRGWTDGVNAELTGFARENRRSTGLADWRGAIAGHLDLLADDEIHPGSDGGQLYAGAVRAALQRLADLPPVKHLDLSGPGPLPL